MTIGSDVLRTTIPNSEVRHILHGGEGVEIYCTYAPLTIKHVLHKPDDKSLCYHRKNLTRNRLA